MSIDTLRYLANMDSIHSFVPLTKILTASDIERLASAGYVIGYTLDEFLEAFPGIDATKIYFNNGIVKTYYFDREQYIIFELYLTGKDYQAMHGVDMQSYISNAVAAFKRVISEKGYGAVAFGLTDRLRMEYIELLASDRVGDNIYQLFLDFYTMSDYGCSRMSLENLIKIISSKSNDEIQKTKNALRSFPATVTLFRGEGEKSTPAEEAWSWTTDINQAYFFAARFSTEGARVIKATVLKENIVEYIGGNEKECLVNPKDINITDTIELHGMSFLDRLTRRIIPLYHRYRNLMLECSYYLDGDEHGEIHSARVLLLSLILAEIFGLSEKERETLATAAIYHDIGRIHDGVDEDHGAESAKLYRGMCADDGGEYNLVAAFLMKYHSLPDEVGYSQITTPPMLSSNVERSRLLFNIFKDADALDRVRFGIRDLDVNQLRLDISKQLVLVAVLLFKNIKLS